MQHNTPEGFSDSQIRDMHRQLSDVAALLAQLDGMDDGAALFHQLADFEDSGSGDPDVLEEVLPRLRVFGEVLLSQLHRRGDPLRALLATLGAFGGSGMLAALNDPAAAGRYLGAAQSFVSAPVGVNDPRGVTFEQPAPGPPGVVADDDAARLRARNLSERGIRSAANDGSEQEPE